MSWSTGCAVLGLESYLTVEDVDGVCVPQPVVLDMPVLPRIRHPMVEPAIMGGVLDSPYRESYLKGWKFPGGRQISAEASDENRHRAQLISALQPLGVHLCKSYTLVRGAQLSSEVTL